MEATPTDGDIRDAIVVGAGPGGLTAGSLLAAEGLAVLVLDSNERPGGTSRGFTRSGFTFPAGPLGFTSPRAVKDVLEGRGAIDGLDIRLVDYVVDAFGNRVKISQEFERLASELALMFPGEQKGVATFFRDIDAVRRELVATPPGATPLLGPLGEESAANLVSRLVSDEFLRRLLGAIGTGEPRAGFPVLAAMWDIMCERGIWYPAGGFNSLAEDLARGLEARGGQVRACCVVSEILVKDGRVYAVSLTDGTVVQAPVVISNADFKTTFLVLLSPDAQPPEWLAAVREAPVSTSIFQVALGIEEREADLSAFEEASRIVYRRGKPDAVQPSPAWEKAEIDPASLAAQELEVSLWSREDPSLAPAGGAVVVIRTAADHAHFAGYRPAPCRRSPGYAGYKERLAGAIVEEASKVLPGLDGAIRVMDVATPLTFEEKGGRFAGCAAGWSQRHGDVGDYAVRSLVRTPIQGLYMAGYQAFSWLYWGGVSTAVLSGASAARSVLKGDGPVHAVTLPSPGKRQVPSESDEPPAEPA